MTAEYKDEGKPPPSQSKGSNKPNKENQSTSLTPSNTPLEKSSQNLQNIAIRHRQINQALRDTNKYLRELNAELATKIRNNHPAFIHFR